MLKIYKLTLLSHLLLDIEGLCDRINYRHDNKSGLCSANIKVAIGSTALAEPSLKLEKFRRRESNPGLVGESHRC